MNPLRRLTNMRFTTVFVFTLAALAIAWRYESAAVGVMASAAGLAAVFVGGGEAKDAYLGSKGVDVSTDKGQ